MILSSDLNVNSIGTVASFVETGIGYFGKEKFGIGTVQNWKTSSISVDFLCSALHWVESFGEWGTVGLKEVFDFVGVRACFC